MRLIAVGVFFIVFMLDTVDGIVARRRGEVSLLGSVLDIASDRALEFVLWVVFADLRLIPVTVPLIVITRGVLVDAVRNVGVMQGQRPFDQMRSSLGRRLVGSRWMRSSYGVSKGFAFGLLTLCWGLLALPQAADSAQVIHLCAQIMTWVAVAICLIRGAPVLVEAWGQLRNQPDESNATLSVQKLQSADNIDQSTR